MVHVHLRFVSQLVEILAHAVDGMHDLLLHLVLAHAEVAKNRQCDASLITPAITIVCEDPTLRYVGEKALRRPMDTTSEIIA